MTNGVFAPDAPVTTAGDVTFYLVNPSSSSAPHQMTILDSRGNMLAASDSVEVSTSAVFVIRGLGAGQYTFYCSFHRAEGMIGTLDVR